jgi:carboxypeptidase C (cathepsin A)
MSLMRIGTYVREVAGIPGALLLAAALVTGTPALAAPEQAASAAKAAVAAPSGGPGQTEKETCGTEDSGTSVTRHSVVVGGRELHYTVTAGRLPVLNDAGETEARIFYIAYTLDQPASAPRRPLLFAFNGGPGAAAVWLHLGAAGPKRVQMLEDGRMPPPPFRLVDNEETWLDRTDLVFVDPVGTGYSRAAKPDLAQKFATVRGDIDSLGRFVRLYLTTYGRWQSPLFLAGESYGSFRVAGLSDHLLEHGIALNGLILISSILNLQTTSFNQGNDLPYQLFLPSYTATAWYHHRLAPADQADLERTLTAAETWADTAYLVALSRGDRLTPGERSGIATTLARFTGLDKGEIERLNLRIENGSFARDLLGERRELVGILDSRFVAENPEPEARSGFDPAVAVIRPPFTSAFNDYVRSGLRYKSDQEYHVLGGGIGHWDWEAKNSYADTSENLRNAMVKNPSLKVFVASGLFDLATPHAAADYTLNHLGLSPDLRKNITIRRYRAGHMMYLDSTSRRELTRDLKEFFAAALASR